MGLNNTPMAERIHIGIFGRRNAGKSSIINAITNQDLAIVSKEKGTTTDPVSKAMELLPLGPVVIIDTPGLDDEGHLGALRIQKTFQVLNKTDIALLIVDKNIGFTATEMMCLERFREKQIPFLIVWNKCDIGNGTVDNSGIKVSAKTREGIEQLKEAIGALKIVESEKPLVADLIEPSDFILLVVPIDSSAPKGRLILPQQQTIRDILEAQGIAIVVKETEVSSTLKTLGKKPKLVITDSQVFEEVGKEVPEDVMLTSFSILFARYKGDLFELVKGAKALKELQDGDIVLISEGCTHHRQCEDIGTVKLPKWMLQYTGKKLIFETSSGLEFPENLTKYKMIVHCGACTLNTREMKYRMKNANDVGIPITNYGILIAEIKGILDRSIFPFR